MEHRAIFAHGAGGIFRHPVQRSRDRGQVASKPRLVHLHRQGNIPLAKGAEQHLRPPFPKRAFPADGKGVFHRRRNVSKKADVSGRRFPALIAIGKDHRRRDECFLGVPGDLSLCFLFRQPAQGMTGKGQAEGHEILPEKADDKPRQRYA